MPDLATVKVPGLIVPEPTSYDWRQAEKLTRKQERLYNEAMRLGGSESEQGRYLTIMRQVADLEMKKHPRLRIYNIHLASKPPVRGLHLTPEFLQS